MTTNAVHARALARLEAARDADLTDDELADLYCDLVADEMTRAVVPNRAARRAAPKTT